MSICVTESLQSRRMLDARERHEARMDKAETSAMELLTGGNSELTAETFSEFLSTATERRTPLLTHTHWLVGPISDAELLGLMLHTSHGDFMVAAACRELTARYLADLNTCAVVDLISEQIGAAA